LVATLLQPSDCVNGSDQEIAYARRGGAPADTALVTFSNSQFSSCATACVLVSSAAAAVTDKLDDISESLRVTGT
jgi:hypothetical protein